MANFPFPTVLLLISMLIVIPQCDSIECGSAEPDQATIESLLADGKFDEAIVICRQQRSAADPRSEAAADWAIRLSQTLSTRQMYADVFGGEEIIAAQQPVHDLLAAYVDHDRRHFLTAQLLQVRREAALYQVTQAMILTDEEAKMAATKTLVRTVASTRELIQEIAAARSERSRPSTTDSVSEIVKLDAELNQLQQRLSVDVLTLTLAQTDLTVPGSVDCIATATNAEQAAVAAIERIPIDAPARMEMQRLRIEAMLRSGQLKRAASEFALLIESLDEPLPPRWLAQRVRILLATDQPQSALAALAPYYGERPQAAAKSLEMDLARLEYLLRYDRDQVGDWLETIQQREGLYGRRRAESIALARIGGDSVAAAADPRLLAAEGQDWLRQGNHLRGGQLLAAAAATDPQIDNAVRHALQAAAAFVAAGEDQRAAHVLIETARQHPRGQDAAEAHLQAIFMLRKLDAVRIVELLQSQLQHWPTGSAAAAARQWLFKHWQDQAKYIAAAELLSQVPDTEFSSDVAVQIADAWRLALQSANGDAMAEATARLQQSIRPRLDQPSMRAQYRMLAATLLDRDALAGLPPSTPTDPFIDALIQFRQQGVVTAELLTVPTDYAADARQRLLRDGRSLPQLRPRILEVLQAWGFDSEPTFPQAECLLWAGDNDQAIQMLNRLIDSSARDRDVLRQAATLLGTADASVPQQTAIQIWDQIAAGSPATSEGWYQAKIAAIVLLRKMGDHEAANRRAKYILLTTPNMDAKWKQQLSATSP